MNDIEPTTVQQLPLEWVVLRLIEFAAVRAWKWLRTNPWCLSINKEEEKVEVSFAASTAAAAKASLAEPEDATKRLPAAPAQEPPAKTMKKAEKKQSGKKAGLRRRHSRRPSHD